jgi:hypothetical protein
MSFYYDIHRLDKKRATRTAAGLPRLKNAFRDAEERVPEGQKRWRL